MHTHFKHQLHTCTCITHTCVFMHLQMTSMTHHAHPHLHIHARLSLKAGGLLINISLSALDCYPPHAVSQGSKLLTNARICAESPAGAEDHLDRAPLSEAAVLRPVCARLYCSCEERALRKEISISKGQRTPPLHTLAAPPRQTPNSKRAQQWQQQLRRGS